MSVTDVHKRIDNLRRLIDVEMQMEIWPQLLRMCSDTVSDIDLNTNTLMGFLITVARKSQTKFTNANAASASEFAAGGPFERVAAPVPATTVQTVFGGLAPAPSAKSALVDMRRYRAAARRLIQHYTLNTTTSSEFKVRDVVMTMIFLERSDGYHQLFKLLETAMEDNTCRPQLTEMQTNSLLQTLRTLLEMPATPIDMTTADVMRSSFIRCFASPVLRYAKIVLLQGETVGRDKRTTLEELLVERGDNIQKLQPQQYITSGSEIPFCDDPEFINKLLKHLDPYPLSRMYYNAANSMFYTTMENYAVANCKFNIEDYNKIFKGAESVKRHANKTAEDNDDLDIYLGMSAKRKK
ncbi:unknown [Choristoneura fumiferana multiple nucleopolyhedrovirus]|uniref:P40 n=1 Tax=Choristoneura fumiferana nuclear polyhedrosis virus TaxID=208973 RepID=Q7TLQ4_NPVCF|nr:unknown [Choristoneura fumiferana multiple nucleopolyhedrovirus]AAP29876.1 unknown [Choristoneura fumiferana multiple nucleopolyhedrovirus]